MAKNIEMNHLNENGEYEVVYPLVNTNTIVDFDDIVLSDAAKIIMNLSDTATPNEAFIHLALGNNAYPFLIQVNFPDGTPAEGVTITGATDPLGNTIVTNAKGQGVAVSDTKTLSIGAITNWIDLESIATTTFTHDDNVITEAVLNFAYSNNNQKTVTTSTTFKISPVVNLIDFCVCAGGGGGGGGANGRNYAYLGTADGGGGGGGYVANLLNHTPLYTETYTLTVGGGGTAGSVGGNGGTGGTSKIVASVSGNVVSASGGTGGSGAVAGSSGTKTTSNGGSGNGKGGSSVGVTGSNSETNYAGGSASVYIFNDSSLGLAGGGGGGGGTSALGGLPNGGKGSGRTAGNGKAFGGGGSGGWTGGSKDDSGTKGGTGGAGGVYIRWHYKS